MRIAAYSQGKIYLSNRSMNCIIDRGKLDMPMECYLRYEEEIEKGAQRLIKSAFPKAKGSAPFFNIRYHYENELTNRLIYLFIVEVDDPTNLVNPNFKNGKLWSFTEIEELPKDRFSECFLHEYDHLKEVICTREKYKEF